jgi:hypothetical protein
MEIIVPALQPISLLTILTLELRLLEHVLSGVLLRALAEKNRALDDFILKIKVPEVTHITRK